MTDAAHYKPRHAAWDESAFDDGAEEALASLAAPVPEGVPVPAAAEPGTQLLESTRAAASDVDRAGTTQAAGDTRAQQGARRPAPKDTPPTIRRPPRAAAGRGRKAVPSTPYADDEFLERDRRARRASARSHRVASILLRMAAFAPRLLAIATCALVVAGALPQTSSRLVVIDATTALSRLLPSALSGIMVIATPFGGAFRGDFALFALGLFLLDWLLVRISALVER